MKNKELKAYQKMLLSILELNEGNKGTISVSIVTFLKGFNKHWDKYYAKDFNKKVEESGEKV